jgi:hypothetical protein
MFDPSIDDRLHKLNEEFRKLLGVSDLEKTTPECLVEFGLTLKEAKAWLENEPSFQSDVSCHDDENRRFFTGNKNRRRLDRTRNIVPRFWFPQERGFVGF